MSIDPNKKLLRMDNSKKESGLNFWASKISQKYIFINLHTFPDTLLRSFVSNLKKKEKNKDTIRTLQRVTPDVPFGQQEESEPQDRSHWRHTRHRDML